MNHLQYFQKQQHLSNDVSVDAPGADNNNLNDEDLKGYNQTLSGSRASSHNQNVSDRIRNYFLYILMFVLTSHAFFSKLKNFFAKNVLATEDVPKILRVIFLAVRNLRPGQQQNIQSAVTTFVNQLSYGDLSERLLTQFKTLAPDLYTQIDAISMTGETVVTALWQYIFIFWMPH